MQQHQFKPKAKNPTGAAAKQELNYEKIITNIFHQNKNKTGTTFSTKDSMKNKTTVASPPNKYNQLSIEKRGGFKETDNSPKLFAGLLHNEERKKQRKNNEPTVNERQAEEENKGKDGYQNMQTFPSNGSMNNSLGGKKNICTPKVLKTRILPQLKENKMYGTVERDKNDNHPKMQNSHSTVVKRNLQSSKYDTKIFGEGDAKNYNKSANKKSFPLRSKISQETEKVQIKIKQKNTKESGKKIVSRNLEKSAKKISESSSPQRKSYMSFFSNKSNKNARKRLFKKVSTAEYKPSRMPKTKTEIGRLKRLKDKSASPNKKKLYKSSVNVRYNVKDKASTNQLIKSSQTCSNLRYDRIHSQKEFNKECYTKINTNVSKVYVRLISKRDPSFSRNLVPTVRTILYEDSLLQQDIHGASIDSSSIASEGRRSKRCKSLTEARYSKKLQKSNDTSLDQSSHYGEKEIDFERINEKLNSISLGLNLVKKGKNLAGVIKNNTIDLETQ